MLKKICISFFAVALLSNCAVKIPDIKGCSPVEGFPGVAALCQQTNTDKSERLTLDQWIDFLYAQTERVDPRNPKVKLAAKGPAVCFSSDDVRKNETAIAELCVKIKCTYEQKKALERISTVPANAQKLSK